MNQRSSLKAPNQGGSRVSGHAMSNSYLSRIFIQSLHFLYPSFILNAYLITGNGNRPAVNRRPIAQYVFF
jgi:hypothetical protein